MTEQWAKPETPQLTMIDSAHEWFRDQLKREAAAAGEVALLRVTIDELRRTCSRLARENVSLRQELEAKGVREKPLGEYDAQAFRITNEGVVPVSVSLPPGVTLPQGRPFQVTWVSFRDGRSGITPVPDALPIRPGGSAFGAWYPQEPVAVNFHAADPGDVGFGEPLSPDPDNDV